MNNNTLPLVNFEQAKKLKAVNFDWPCDAWYYTNGDQEGACRGITTDRNAFVGMWSAPTVALSLKWMRDVKGLMCGVGVAYTETASRPRFELAFVRPVGIIGVVDFDTYEAAESALLEELLSLIENDGINKKN